MDSGHVYWVTGLAGAGKSTIARALYQRILAKGRPVVLLDGDGLREVFGGVFGHAPEERLELARRYGRLCALLAGQGLDVVIGTISMFHEVRRDNRSRLTNYSEIFLDVPMEVLEARDQKGLYSRARQGLETNVVGVDLEPELPETPDVVLDNDGRRPAAELVDECCARLGL